MPGRARGRPKRRVNGKERKTRPLAILFGGNVYERKAITAIETKILIDECLQQRKEMLAAGHFI